VLDLNLVVADMEKMLHRLIGEDVDLVTRADAGLGCVKVDPGQIEQVIMNLAVNSRDAMPAGGRLSIETRNVELDEEYASDNVGVRPGRYVLLSVGDTGCGISDEVRGHLFEPFFTTKEQGKGTGLGLSTVYGIVAQSGGHIAVESEVGRGTRFLIYLPRAEEDASRDEADEAPPPARSTETILLVEDDEMVRETIQEALESNGHVVLAAASADEGVRIAESHIGPIHLLVTDVVMPRRGGRELAEALRRLRPDMRVLYVSGYPNDSWEAGGEFDARTFLSKPFTPDALLHKVREVLASPTGL
jgi:CheY-like chemotaxis protein